MNLGYPITERESEVLHLITYEYTSKEIAKSLNVSEETVITHRKSLLKKLAVKNTAGLVRIAIEKGIVHIGISIE